MMTDERDIEIAEILGIMRSTGGRKTMYRILQFTGVDIDTFSADTHEHAKNAGMREVGIWLRDELKSVDYDLYMMMMKENEDG